jgi:hypothetical protein
MLQKYWYRRTKKTRLLRTNQSTQSTQSIIMLIHIGYPKAASNFLQKCVFSNDKSQSPFMMLSG